MARIIDNGTEEGWERMGKSTMRLRKRAVSHLKSAVAVKPVGNAGHLCMWCLRFEPSGLNKVFETRKFELCAYYMFTYFFLSPVMGLTSDISLRVK